MTASEMEAAQRMFQTFLDQWRTGSNAKLEFFCEGGCLKLNMSADLGPWSGPTFEPWSKVRDDGSLHKASPSRLKSRLRRASERERTVAAERVLAEKFAVEKVATKKIAAEKVTDEKTAAEEAVAEKAAAEKAATGAEENIAVEKVAA